jgi:hypothetical protein
VTFDKTAQLTGFVALAATSFLGSATAATAANVTGCGLEPVGGNLENNAGVCELTFDNAGSYSWTLPAGISGLHAIVVGGGGGADFRSPNFGYAGNGGGIDYVDLTGVAANGTITGTVGEGGTSTAESATSGGNTTLSVNGGSNYIGGGGSAAAMSLGTCAAGIPGYWGEGEGAAGVGWVNFTDPCAGGGLGIVPDNDGNAPTIFDGFTTELGRGGGVFTDEVPMQTPGRGGSVFVFTGDDTSSVEPTGADGIVVFRYTASDDNNIADSSGGANDSSGSLANTGNGVPVAAVTLASIGLIAAGLGATMISRQRHNRS